MLERDRHGARALAVLGGIIAVGNLVAIFTVMGSDEFPILCAGLALGIGMLAGALARWHLGRAIPDAAARLERHLAGEPTVRSWLNAGGSTLNGFLRLVAFAIDAAVVVGAVAIPLDTYFRRGARIAYEYSSRGGRFSRPQGTELLGIFKQFIDAGHNIDIVLTPFFGPLGAALYLFVPAAAFAATPGLALVGRRWVRNSDGERAGALHASMRALFGLLLSPLQFAFTFFDPGKLYRVTNLHTGEERLVSTGKTAIRRTLADAIFRLEAPTRTG